MVEFLKISLNFQKSGNFRHRRKIYFNFFTVVGSVVIEGYFPYTVYL